MPLLPPLSLWRERERREERRREEGEREREERERERRISGGEWREREREERERERRGSAFSISATLTLLCHAFSRLPCLSPVSHLSL